MNFIFSIKKNNGHPYTQNNTKNIEPVQINEPKLLNKSFHVSLKSNNALGYNMIQFVDSGNKSCNSCHGVK